MFADGGDENYEFPDGVGANVSEPPLLMHLVPALRMLCWLPIFNLNSTELDGPSLPTCSLPTPTNLLLPVARTLCCAQKIPRILPPKLWPTGRAVRIAPDGLHLTNKDWIYRTKITRHTRVELDARRLLALGEGDTPTDTPEA